MDSKLLNPTPIITETPSRPTFVRPLLFQIREQAAITGSTAGVITAADLAVLDAQQGFQTPTSQNVRFDNVRIRSIQIWGPDQPVSGEIPTSVGVSCNIVESDNNLTGGDGAVFRDFGTDGAFRAALNIRPNFGLRQQWFSTNSGTENSAPLFNVGALPPGDTNILLSVTVRVVCEFR